MRVPNSWALPISVEQASVCITHRAYYSKGLGMGWHMDVV
jgi:hypothetical protein